MRIVASTRPNPGSIAIRSLVIGFGYAVLSAVAALLLGPLSSQRPAWDNFLLWWLSGTLVALCAAPFVLSSTWSRFNTVLSVWAALVFVRTFGLGIEGSLFKPSQANVALVAAAVGVVVTLVLAWLIIALLMPIREPPSRPEARHGWWYWTWRVLAVGLAYIILYFVFGAANALLYTRSFYENNPKYGLNLPPAGTIFLALLIRGPLFGLGSLFITRASNMPRGRTGIWLGLLLYVIGGLGPYLETTFRTMPLGFNLATLLELFLQNFLTGIVAARIYKPAPAKT